MLGTVRANSPQKIDSQRDFEVALHGNSDGQVFICNIKCKGNVQLKNFSRKYIQNLMNEHAFDGLYDTYISVNTFWGDKKDTQHLKRICALFSDIDCRSDYTPEQTFLQIQAEVFNENILPQPSIVVFTGRGLHFYWLLSNEDKNALPSWKIAQRDIYNKLCIYGADSSAMDAARIMRLPNTLNSKNNMRSTVWEYTRLEYRLNVWLREMNLIIPESAEKRRSLRMPTQKQIDTVNRLAKFCTLPVPKIKSDWEANLFIKECISKQQDNEEKGAESGFTSKVILGKKLYDLFLLAQLRKGVDCYRQNILFLTTIWSYSMSRDYLFTEKNVMQLNNTFEYPLKIGEVEKTLRVAVSAMNRGVYYHYRNDTVLRFLHITSEEQKHLKYFTEAGISERIRYRSMSKQEKDAYRYRKKLQESGKLTLKEKKIAQMNELVCYLRRGFSHTRICECMKISRSSFYRLKKLLSEQENLEFRVRDYKNQLFRLVLTSILVLKGYGTRKNDFSLSTPNRESSMADFLSLILTLCSLIKSCKGIFPSHEIHSTG